METDLTILPGTPGDWRWIKFPETVYYSLTKLLLYKDLLS